MKKHPRTTIIAILICASCTQTARTPKIYNALITSDENLAPSQAFPIIEPVLRSTALGVALPPLVVHPQVHSYVPQHTAKEASRQQQEQQPQEEYNKQTQQSQKLQQPQLTYHGSLYPVAYDPYLAAYGYHNELLYPVLPYYQQPVYVDYGHYQNPQNAPVPAIPPTNEQKQQQQQQQEDIAPINSQQDDIANKQVQPLPPQNIPPSHALNFKKNPDIPDVIPPLPVTLRKGRKNT